MYSIISTESVGRDINYGKIHIPTTIKDIVTKVPLKSDRCL